MSHQAIVNSLTTAQTSFINGLIRNNQIENARMMIPNASDEDFNSYVSFVQSQDWSNPEDLDTANTTVPAGANTVRSMVTDTTGGVQFTPAPTESAKHTGITPAPEVEVSDDELRGMWRSVDDYDINILSADLVEAFQYQGFNPDAVLKSLMRKKKSNSVSNKQFLLDVTILCALAVVKGSITDNNIKKMSDKGKSTYDELEKRYGITRGGGKGKPAEVITISRIAAAFPGKVMQLIQAGKVPARKFIGDLNTHKLPAIVQHQALAACIPKDLAERSRMFLLHLITAYSVDQTKVISKVKSDNTTLLERQLQFTSVSHNGPYPPEEMRKKIIKTIDFNRYFDDISTVATHIKSKWPEFSMVSKAEFLEDMRKI